MRRDRLLLFASDAQLDLLFKSLVIYMDGTFKKAPSHFTQIYIIHIVHFDTCKQKLYFLFSMIFLFILRRAMCVWLIIEQKGRHLQNDLQ